MTPCSLEGPHQHFEERCLFRIYNSLNMETPNLSETMAITYGTTVLQHYTEYHKHRLIYCLQMSIAVLLNHLKAKHFIIQLMHTT